MDFEEFGNLNNDEINAIGLAFIKRLEELTQRPVVVYSNAYTARTVWNGRNSQSSTLGGQSME